MSKFLNSLQEVKVGIGKEDLVGGVVDGQSIGPLQLGCDNGANVASVHADSADICRVTPVGPVQPSEGERGTDKQFKSNCRRYLPNHLTLYDKKRFL